MAKKWSNQDLPGALHFVTGNVNNRIQIFRRASYCRAFLEECLQLRKDRECKLIAFVLMPDHFHLIINPRDGKVRAWTGALKSLTAVRLIKTAPESLFIKSESEHQVWQESFKALPL